MPAPAPPDVSTLSFEDDGSTPNNPSLPALLYRGAIDDTGDLAEAFETFFQENEWQGMWRWGIYPFHHFHSTAHEALGVACGSARLQLGGSSGKEVDIRSGDLVVLPAGTGHKCIESSDEFMVVGAYPPGQEADLIRSGEGDLEKARNEIARVPIPRKDPVFGKNGPLVKHWK